MTSRRVGNTVLEIVSPAPRLARFTISVLCLRTCDKQHPGPRAWIAMYFRFITLLPLCYRTVVRLCAGRLLLLLANTMLRCPCVELIDSDALLNTSGRWLVAQQQQQQHVSASRRTSHLRSSPTVRCNKASNISRWIDRFYVLAFISKSNAVCILSRALVFTKFI